MKKIIDLINSDATRKVFLRALTLYVAILIFYVFTISVFLGGVYSEFIVSSMLNVLGLLIGSNVAVGVAPMVSGYINGRKKHSENEIKNNEETIEGASDYVSFGENVLFEEAKKHVGIKEVTGSNHNPIIMQWVKELEWYNDYSIKSDEVPWCSTFVNAMALKCGLQRSNKPNAKSWLKVGVSFKIGDKLPSKPYGIIAVFHRGSNPSSGHVVIVEEAKEAFKNIGGNESDQVKESVKSVHSKEFIEFRLIS